MMRLIALTVALLGFAAAACAQQVQVGTTTVTVPTCTYLGSNGTSFVCAPTPSAGGGTFQNGPCMSVTTAGTVTTIGLLTKVTTLNAGRALVTGDNCNTLSYDSTTAGSITLPAAGSTGFATPFAFCFAVVNTGGLSFTGAAIKAAPASYSRGQSGCLQVDDKSPANWISPGWTPLAVSNAAPF